MQFWLIALTAFFISLIGCWAITQSAWLRNLGNIEPSENRWHQTITPGLGGIPIFIGFAVATLASGAIGPLSSAILVCALPLLVVGTYDDIKPITPKAKLLVQILATALFLLLITTNESLSLITSISEVGPYVLLHWLFCGIWLIAIINAINLLDNMDGLAAGVASIACLTIAYLCGKSDMLSNISLLYYILAAALAGFLMLNRHPAKLFMGDAGALWIGFTVAAGVMLLLSSITLPIKPETTLGYTMKWVFALLICAVPVSDTLMVMITRKMRGQAISIGGKDHLSHRLVSLGLSEKASVAILWLAALIAASLAILIQHFQPPLWIATIFVFFIILFASICWLTNKTAKLLHVVADHSHQHSS